jgi:hypothetical protein
MQAFDVALLAQDVAAVTETLPRAWEAMGQASLNTGFADSYAQRLLRLPLTGETAILAREIALLSGEYETVAQLAVPQSPRERFLFAIARGRSAPPAPDDAMTRMIADVFASTDMPERYARMVAEDRIGEALLRAALVLSDLGDLDDMQDALALFRALGLETVARRTALQLLLLDHRG